MTLRIMRFLMPFYAVAFIGMMVVGILGKVTGWWG